MTIKTSPIRYMGNKRKLIKRGLVDLFPVDINTFYDLFGGSGVVGLNTSASRYVLNEKNKHVFNLYKMFQSTTPSKIIKHTEQTIEQFDLPTIGTDRRSVGTEVRDYYKDKYTKFREHYNNNPNTLDLYVLMNYAMSQTMRFNKKGKFNMPFGNNRFIKEKHGEEIMNFHKFLQSVELHCEDYQNVSSTFHDTDFIYFDPPYLNTTATYNENNGWNEHEQKRLLKYLEELNQAGIKWGLSNVLTNNQASIDLFNWIKAHDFKIHFFDGFDYFAFGRGKSKVSEIYVYNYE